MILINVVSILLVIVIPSGDFKNACLILFGISIFFSLYYVWATIQDEKVNYSNFLNLKREYNQHNAIFMTEYIPSLSYTKPLQYNPSQETTIKYGGYWKVLRIPLKRYTKRVEYPTLDQLIYTSYHDANRLNK